MAGRIYEGGKQRALPLSDPLLAFEFTGLYLSPVICGANH